MGVTGYVERSGAGHLGQRVPAWAWIRNHSKIEKHTQRHTTSSAEFRRKLTLRNANFAVDLALSLGESDMEIKQTRSLFRQTLSAWSDDYAPSMGAALAYYTIFSIAPLLLIIIAVAGWVFGAEAARGEL